MYIHTVNNMYMIHTSITGKQLDFIEASTVSASVVVQSKLLKPLGLPPAVIAPRGHRFKFAHYSVKEQATHKAE
jgi:hypothetical protein